MPYIQGEKNVESALDSAHCKPFFLLIAGILSVPRQKIPYLTFGDKEYRIFTLFYQNRVVFDCFARKQFESY